MTCSVYFVVETSASGLVVKSNVANVGPRVRFSAGASFWLSLESNSVSRAPTNRF